MPATITMEDRPRVSWATFMSFPVYMLCPARSRIVAAPFRSSCSLMGGSPAAAWRTKSSETCHGCSGCPVGDGEHEPGPGSLLARGASLGVLANPVGPAAP